MLHEEQNFLKATTNMMKTEKLPDIPKREYLYSIPKRDGLLLQRTIKAQLVCSARRQSGVPLLLEEISLSNITAAKMILFLLFILLKMSDINWRLAKASLWMLMMSR